MLDPDIIFKERGFMQQAVLILPDSKNRLPDAEVLRRNGFRVSSALGGSADQSAERPVESGTGSRNRDDARCTTSR